MYDVITVGSATVDVFVDTGNKLFKEDENCLSIPFGAKFLVSNIHFDTGGGGTNTGGALARLGLKVAMIGKIGDDHNSEMILRHLSELNCDTSLIVRGNGPSDYSIILDAAGRDRTILTHKRMNDLLHYRELDISRIKTRWFYFCTMLGESLKTQGSLVDYAVENGIDIMFNPGSYIITRKQAGFLKIVKNTKVLIVNRDEAGLLTGKEDLVAISDDILTLGPEVVVITDGSNDAYAFSKEEAYMIKPHKVKVVENTGAGDSFGAGFLAGYMSGGDIRRGLEMGATEAESVIQHLGAKNKLLTMAEINSMIKENPHEILEVKFHD